jgi:hypothetical protein
MYRKWSLLTFFIVLAGMVNISIALDAPVAYYPMEEGSGTVVGDASGNGHDGTIQGTVEWVEGAPDFGGGLSFDGDPANNVIIQGLNPVDPSTGAVSAAAWIKYGGGQSGRNWNGIAGKGGTGGLQFQWLISNFGTIGAVGLGFGAPSYGTAIAPVDEWMHVAFAYDGGTVTFYANGEPAGTMTGTINQALADTPVYIGNAGNPNFAIGFNGDIDEVAFFDYVISEADVMDIMTGALAQKGPALGASPSNGAKDVFLDTTLSWKPGPYADTHNVFFGTDFNDVNDATTTDPLGATLSAEQDANTFDPGSLTYGTTYYWRVDEVNAPSAPGEYKGNVWSFTAELIGYPLDTDYVTATASPTASEQDPNSTCNGDGLDEPNDTHGVDAETMYLCDGSPAWIQYEFDKVYNVYDLLIWNYNEEGFAADMGAKDVNLAYSEDGQTWTDLSGSFVLEKAPGDNTCGPNPPIIFGGIPAKYVKLMLNTNYVGWIDSYGISEVRFSVVPMRASRPSPADGASNIDIDPTLSWRRGRGVIEHNVYLGTDESAVEGGTADLETVTQAGYTPSQLTLDTTYYWRVDEVNSLADYPTWSGDVWSFSTVDSIVVEDFERYTDTQPDTVWDTWKDGLTDSANGGSTMGNELAPFCEQDIVHGGDQSAPLYYDNTTGTISQVVVNTSSLAIGSNWNAIGGASTLAIWFQGEETNAATDQIYAKLNNTKFVYDGPVSDISRTAWTKFEIPLAGINLSSVTTITIGVEKTGATGGSGKIYLDDLELIIGVVASDPGTDNLVARYDMENNLVDSVGGYNGTGNGNLTYEAGRDGMALVFDGNNATFVDLPIGDLISTMESCTISSWVNWSGAGGSWQRIFDFGTGTTNYIFMSTNAGSVTTGSQRSAILVNGDPGGEDGVSSPPKPGAGVWEHMTVVIDAENSFVKLYLNGDLLGTDTTLRHSLSELGVTNQNYLGKSQWSSDGPYDGMLDDFRIYNRALSDGEVKYLFKN